MVEMFRKLLQALPPHQRHKLPWFALPIAAAGLLQLAAVASVAPFMAALSRPDDIGTHALLSRLHELLGLESQKAFVIALGAGVFVLIIASNAMSAWTNWMVLRFAYMQEHYVTTRLLESYLYRPYVYFVQRNTAELSKVLFIEVRRVIIGVLVPGMLLVAKLVTAFFILALLIFVEPLLAIIVVGGSAVAYLGVYSRLRRRLRDVGEGSVHNATARTKIVADALGGVKELKVLGREAEFVRYYSRPSKSLAAGEALSHTSVDVPRYALEAIAFGSLLGVLLYLVARSDEIAQALPLATVYGFAGYRLFPAIQELLVATTKMRYHAAALDVVVAEMAGDAPVAAAARADDGEPMYLDKQLRLIDASFSYPGAPCPSLAAVDVAIARGEVVGVVGPTGSGKTSFLDILAGLVHPSSGRFCIDAAVIGPQNVRRWQKSIGYVPQNVFLADDTVIRNIAFGESDAQLDMARVREAARVAQIDAFISNELADGYDTLVGERGVKLSGGQRQRIAIARALYRDPSVLLLDEATSALDPDTEAAVLTELRRSCGGKTVVLVSHRPAGLAQCDKLLVFEAGRLVDQGPVEGLMAGSPYVRRLLAAHGRRTSVE